MPAYADVRPGGLDLSFRPGTTFTVTLNCPPGSLAGHVFTATLAGIALTTPISVVGNVMTVTVTDTETTARGVGVHKFELREEIAGTPEPIVVGDWTGSDRATTTSTTPLEVAFGGATATVTVPGMAGAVGSLVVSGAATFGQSPIVPNPAALTPGAAASVDEVEALIAESAAGFVRSMDPKTALSAVVSNSTTETSCLNAGFVMPKPVHEMVYRVTAAGILRNSTGGAVTFTFRLKNTTDATTIALAAVALATDALGTRPWRFEVVGEGNTFLAASMFGVAHLLIGNGTTDGTQHAMSQAVNVEGTDPQTWDVTAQMSVANAQASVTVYSAQIAYGFPGA